MLANERPTKYLMNVCIRNNCVCTHVSMWKSGEVAACWTHDLKYKIQIKSRLLGVYIYLVGSWTLSKHSGEPDHSSDSVTPNPVSYQRCFLPCNNSKYRVSSSFSFSLFSCLCAFLGFLSFLPLNFRLCIRLAWNPLCLCLCYYSL